MEVSGLDSEGSRARGAEQSLERHTGWHRIPVPDSQDPLEPQFCTCESGGISTKVTVTHYNHDG